MMMQPAWHQGRIEIKVDKREEKQELCLDLEAAKWKYSTRFGFRYAAVYHWTSKYISKNDDFEIILYTFLGTIIQLTYTYPNNFFRKKYRFSLKNIKTDFRSYLMKKCSSGHL